MSSSQEQFKQALAKVGKKPTGTVPQHVTRHYSETLSREVALWIRGNLEALFVDASVLHPEDKVDTIFGQGNRGKSLDVGVLDKRKYLLLDVSIKTFNFKDRKTGNYRHNYTGRFYELLGEELDIRRSYPHATLVAIIFVPEDSVFDSSPSSFAHGVRQFSKIAKTSPESNEQGFEHVFVAVHNENGKIYFFDATGTPNIQGHPPESSCRTLEDIVETLKATCDSRSALIQDAPLPRYDAFEYAAPHQTKL